MDNDLLGKTMLKTKKFNFLQKNILNFLERYG